MLTRRSHLYYLLYVCKGTYFAANESQKQKKCKKKLWMRWHIQILRIIAENFGHNHDTAQ